MNKTVLAKNQSYTSCSLVVKSKPKVSCLIRTFIECILFENGIMIRVILAPNDLLTPFDLRAQNFRVNVEFSTEHRGQNFFSKKCPKVGVFLIHF